VWEPLGLTSRVAVLHVDDLAAANRQDMEGFARFAVGVCDAAPLAPGGDQGHDRLRVSATKHLANRTQLVATRSYERQRQQKEKGPHVRAFLR